MSVLEMKGELHDLLAQVNAKTLENSLSNF